MRIFIAQVFALIALINGSISHAIADNQYKPWLQPANPSAIEWFALELQASEGDEEYGENYVTIAFYLGPKSFTDGIIYCDISYLPNARAELVQMIESGIRKRFNLSKNKLYPWANLEIKTEVASLKDR